MTKDELKKEAEEYARQSRFTELPNPSLSEDIDISDEILEAYLASAEPREKRIAELEAQIEKMKNCKNCKKLKKEKDGLLICTVGSFYTNTFGENCDKWEIKENDNTRIIK